YGDNAVGGVVNIITKQGTAGISGKLSAYYGSYDSFGQDLQVSGREKDLAFFFSAHHFDKRGYRRQSDEFYKNFNGRLDYDLNEALSFGIQYGSYEDSYELPGGLNAAELETLGRRGSAGTELGNIADTEDQYVQAYVNFEPVFAETYIGRLEMDASWRDRELFDTFDAFNLDTEREVETEGLAVKYIYDEEFYGRDVDFLMGFDKHRHSSFIQTNTPERLTISKDEYGFFTSLDLEVVDKLFFTGGHRYHKAQFTFDQQLPAPNFERQKPDVSVSTGGVRYEYAQGSNVFFKFEQSFRFLTPNEWYSSFTGLDTDLKQQRGRLYELGVKHNFADRALITMTPYWMETDKEIFYDPTDGLFGSNSNYDEIRRVGVELGSRIDIRSFFEDAALLEQFDLLECFANYTYQNPEFTTGSFDGNKVPWVPEHQANMGLTARFNEYYRVTLIGRYIGSRYAINDQPNTLNKAKDYVVTDLKVSYERKNFEMFLAVNNLFDRKYNTYESTNSSQSTRDFFPAAEKNFLAGVVIKF
ncbi:MAG: TonB-dependent receptor, partial [Candidatus Omnitrophica bacterium]|nr:TonB-dependent receptor [Candidatus Omnitrophota bacterium]